MNHDDWRLLSSNALTRVRTYARFDADGQMICKEEMPAADANALADQTHELAANDVHWRHRLRRSTQNHYQSVARIPAVIVNELMRQGIWGNAERMTAWLNDPDHKVWRTGGGTVKIKET